MEAKNKCTKEKNKYALSRKKQYEKFKIIQPSL